MFLARRGEQLAGFERAVALRRPENILALGFAIVRTGDGDGGTGGGRAVFDAAALAEGQVLDITLHKGVVKAVATATADNAGQ